MCISAGLMIASAVLSTGAAVQAGEQARIDGHTQQYMLDREAKMVESEAAAQARKIREAGKKAQGQAVAAVAGSGMDVNSTSATDINAEIGAAYEEDALVTLATGGNVASTRRFEAAMANTAGHVRHSSALMSAAARGLQGWGAAYPTRVAAPVDTSRNTIYGRG